MRSCAIKNEYTLRDLEATGKEMSRKNQTKNLTFAGHFKLFSSNSLFIQFKQSN